VRKQWREVKALREAEGKWDDVEKERNSRQEIRKRLQRAAADRRTWIGQKGGDE